MLDKTRARLPGLPLNFAPQLDGQAIYMVSGAAPRQSKLFSLVMATLPPEICFVNP